MGGDTGGPGWGMTRILLLLGQKENQRLLADELGQGYEIITGGEEELEQDFDLCVIDGPTLERLRERVSERKASEQPIFLPILLVTSRPGVKMITRHLWRSVDERLITPIEKPELRARICAAVPARRGGRTGAVASTRDVDRPGRPRCSISAASGNSRAVMRLIDSTDGEIRFHGDDITAGAEFVRYSGIAGMTTGFILKNNLLIVAGSLVGRGGRFLLVAGLIAWGGAPFERILRRFVEPLGWAVVVLLAVVLAAVAGAWLGAYAIGRGLGLSRQLAALVGPIISTLLPVLIGYTGGRLVHGQRGAVIGAVARRAGAKPKHLDVGAGRGQLCQTRDQPRPFLGREPRLRHLGRDPDPGAEPAQEIRKRRATQPLHREERDRVVGPRGLERAHDVRRVERARGAYLAQDGSREGDLVILVREHDERSLTGAVLPVADRDGVVVVGVEEVAHRVDVTVAEKFRQVLEAYQVELEYGRTIEAYTGTVDVDGQNEHSTDSSQWSVQVMYGAAFAVFRESRRSRS